MGKQEDLIKLDRAIKDAEVRLHTFKINIDVIKKEIYFLEKLAEQIEENIAYLKNNKTIALAMEYKKSREDLKKTKNRLLQLRSDLLIIEKAHKDVQSFMEKDKEMYDKLSKQNDNNVLRGKFGKRNV